MLIMINGDNKKRSLTLNPNPNPNPKQLQDSAHCRALCSADSLYVLDHASTGFQLTIGSCFSVHYRVMEHVGSLESTKEA